MDAASETFQTTSADHLLALALQCYASCWGGVLNGPLRQWKNGFRAGREFFLTIYTRRVSEVLRRGVNYYNADDGP